MSNTAGAETDLPALTAKPMKKPRIIDHRLLETGQFADLVIICKERTWNVHKAIVCPQSDFFMSACGGHFSEANSGRIDLSCDDEDVLHTLITYLYHGDPESTSWDPEDADDVDLVLSDISANEGPMHWLHVHILADKYHIEDLADLAAHRFKLLAETMAYNAGFATWFVAVLEDTSPTSSLRGWLFDFVLHDMEELLDEMDGQCVDEVAAFKAALSRCPDFAVPVMIAHIQTPT